MPSTFSCFIDTFVRLHAGRTLSEVQTCWCMQVCATDAAVDQSLEDQGVRRVIGALQAHTWPGLQMKGPANGHAAVPAVSEDPGADPSVASAPATSWQPGRSDEDAAHAGTASTAERSMPEARQQQEGGVVQAHAAGDAAGSGSHVSQAEPYANGHHDDDPGAHAEEAVFERLMGRVSAVRGHVAGLPDGERRARAADLALQMLSAFGLGEDSEDEEG